MDRKKELILQYKQTPRPMGVFQIKNTATGKIFISGSMNLPGSFNSQKFQLSTGAHRIQELQAEWNSYGPDAFVFDTLETINPEKVVQADWRKAVSALEDKWLDRLQPYGEKGYNKPKKKGNANRIGG